jgi:6-phosphogluconolactonase
MNNNISYFKETSKANQYVIQQWQMIAEEAIASRGIFTVALSGGSSPISLYQALARVKELPWSSTQLFLVDERFVLHENLESNYRMIKEQLLDQLSLNEAQIHTVPIDKTPEKSASAYANELKENFNFQSDSFPSFDLILLGLGEDGHTASLFTPQDCHEKKKLVMHTLSPKAPHDRITLTLPVLNHAKHVIFYIRGENKTQIVKRVFQQKDSHYPASHITSKDKKIIMITNAN